MRKLTADDFANLLIMAVQIRENSWNPAKSGRSKKLYVRPFGEYRLTIGQAALLACRKLKISVRWCKPVELLMVGTWNDSIMWAEKHLQR
jgi:hypothetical protein